MLEADLAQNPFPPLRPYQEEPKPVFSVKRLSLALAFSINAAILKKINKIDNSTSF